VKPCFKNKQTTTTTTERGREGGKKREGEREKERI
jgi:hypothetical protein